MAEPDEQLPCELGYSLGHGRQATLQSLMQVFIGVVLGVQEWVSWAILGKVGETWPGWCVGLGG